ncbi:MAG: hypothetical protein F6K47_31375 [Symploca sp. SIO2E6]|nr:hypothetical protein [Symploca sp. SIO2E6]
MQTLAQEPLLLYLLAVMHRDDQLKVEMYEQANTGGAKILIYEQAVRWVLERQRTEAGRNLNLKIADVEDLRSILDEAGLCVVQTGHEYASISLIENRLINQEDEGATAIIAAARKQSQENPLKNALAAFYLKSAQGADNSVEFFHKSFGEFLCAERIVNSFEDWTSKIGKRGKTYSVSTKELWWQVYDLFGYGHLTPEIVEYLMALLQKRRINAVGLFERLNDFYLLWSDGEFIETTEDILPKKKARELQKQGIDKGTREVDIYTGLNILIILMELHRYGQSVEHLKAKIDFHPCGHQVNSEEFDDQRLSRIIGYSECLGKLTFSQKFGNFLHNINLSHANLSFTNLSNVNLKNVNLSYANLSYTYWRDADLSDADLSDADLSDADLSNVAISYASTDGSLTCGICGYDKNPKSSEFCDACGSQLYKINFVRANLSNAKLCRASFRNVNFINANLSGANLNGTDLSGADLNGTDLSGADLNGTDLSGANLENINLTNVKNQHRAIGLYQIRLNTYRILPPCNLALFLLPSAFCRLPSCHQGVTILPDLILPEVTEFTLKPVIVSSNDTITCDLCGYNKNPKSNEFCDACGSELSIQSQ